MNTPELESIDNSLKSIAKSLNTLVEDTKASSKLKQELHDYLTELELSIKEIKENPFGLNERN